MKASSQIKIPIVAKLVTVSLGLLVAATITIAVQNSKFIEKGSRDRETNTNSVQAKMVAATMSQTFDSIFYKTKVLGGALFRKYPSEQERNQALELSFTQEDSILGVWIYERTADGIKLATKLVKEDFLTEHSLSEADLIKAKESAGIKIEELFEKEERTVANTSLSEDVMTLTAVLPFAKDSFDRITHIAAVDLKWSLLEKFFNEVDARTLFMFDKNGTVVAHPNHGFVASRKDYWAHPLVDKAKNTLQSTNASLNFIDSATEERFAGSFYKVPGYDLYVVSQAKEAVILEPAKEIKRKAVEITGYVVSLSIFLIFLFSVTITKPIESLLKFSLQVAKGNFEIKAPIKSSDEVGELTQAFNHMVDGLKERDKIKNIMTKFHGSTVTDDLLKGDLMLGGKRKLVTVFFSDIRNFTQFSESHTPEEVVDMLNEYFQIMVGVITKHHGIVDKFVGDAIMATWGAPKSTGEDPVHAVRACLEMRKALAELNQKRRAQKKTPIKVGMGLHSGEAISGTIGSTERMEFTVIGDTVNMASRIESATKQYGVDLLVSEVTLQELRGKFIFEDVGFAELKGKSKPVALFKIKGYYDDAGKPVTVETEYSNFSAVAS